MSYDTCTAPFGQDDDDQQQQQQQQQLHRVDASVDQLEDYAARFRSLMSTCPNPGVLLSLTKVLDFLYIGSKYDARDRGLMQSVGITHIINCVTSYCRTGREFYGKSIQRYVEFDAEDDCTYDMMQHFDDAFEVIEDARMKGGKAFIHCELGINRSGVLTVAYLMVYNQVDPITAALYVKSRRKRLLSNTDFQEQLIKFAVAKNLISFESKKTGDEAVHQTQPGEVTATD